MLTGPTRGVSNGVRSPVFQQRSVAGPLYYQIAVAVAEVPKMRACAKSEREQMQQFKCTQNRGGRPRAAAGNRVNVGRARKRLRGGW